MKRSKRNEKLKRTVKLHENMNKILACDMIISLPATKKINFCFILLYFISFLL